VSCPDSSILVEAGKVVGIDDKHCKGCGICAKECPTKPVKGIVMLPGGVYQGNEMRDRRGLAQ
jgi:Pyruvate/2-oxoacid:ferredoxin oxidoreductase delta subunit